MPAEIEPPELAQLVDFAERSRTHDWSLRSALMRYAQPQPARVSQVLDLVRRIESALRPQLKLIEKDGPELWRAVESGEGETAGPKAFVAGLLRAMAALDGLGDVLAEWAVDRAGERPDAEVDAVIADVTAQLEVLGVPHEERVRPGRQRA